MKYVALGLLALASLPAHMAVAQEAPAATSSFSIKPFAGAGLTFGGKKLLEAEMSDGSSKSVSSGGFVDLRVGLEYPLIDSPWAIQAAVAYHVDDISASNGDFKFSRVPVELLGMYSVNDQWRVGFGLRKATAAKTKGSGFFAGTSVDLKSDMGIIVQGEYRISPRFSLLGRAVSESYKTDDAYQDKIQGNHFGLLAAFYFK